MHLQALSFTSRHLPTTSYAEAATWTSAKLCTYACSHAHPRRTLVHAQTHTHMHLCLLEQSILAMEKARKAAALAGAPRWHARNPARFERKHAEHGKVILAKPKVWHGAYGAPPPVSDSCRLCLFAPVACASQGTWSVQAHPGGVQLAEGGWLVTERLVCQGSPGRGQNSVGILITLDSHPSFFKCCTLVCAMNRGWHVRAFPA